MDSGAEPDDSRPVTFLGRPLGPSFRTKIVTIAPRASLPYVEDEWRDALVVVEIGEIEMECREGERQRFRTGAVLWFADLGLLALLNPGDEVAVLVAVWRRSAG